MAPHAPNAPVTGVPARRLTVLSYNGSDKAYVGVMAQEVQTIMPDAVVRGSDGYLRVYYDKLGLKFQTYDQWVASGAYVPAGAPIEH